MIREEVFNCAAAAEKLTSVLLFVCFDCRATLTLGWGSGVMNRKSLIIHAALQHSPLELATNPRYVFTVPQLQSKCSI